MLFVGEPDGSCSWHPALADGEFGSDVVCCGEQLRDGGEWDAEGVEVEACDDDAMTECDEFVDDDGEVFVEEVGFIDADDLSSSWVEVCGVRYGDGWNGLSVMDAHSFLSGVELWLEEF